MNKRITTLATVAALSLVAAPATSQASVTDPATAEADSTIVSDIASPDSTATATKVGHGRRRFKIRFEGA